MIPSVSFFKINLWVAILLALTVFSGTCVNQSMGFTTISPTVSVQRSAAPTRTKIWMSTVVDNPTTTKPNIEINKDDLTEKEENTGKNGWEVQLFNDPYNHRTFVAKCLCTICGKSDSESYQIMMQAHKNG